MIHDKETEAIHWNSFTTHPIKFVFLNIPNSCNNFWMKGVFLHDYAYKLVRAAVTQFLFLCGKYPHSSFSFRCSFYRVTAAVVSGPHSKSPSRHRWGAMVTFNFIQTVYKWLQHSPLRREEKKKHVKESICKIVASLGFGTLALSTPKV